MALEHESDSAIARAVRAAGSQSSLARRVGRNQSTIATWLKNGRMSADAALIRAVEAATGVSRHELRPDIYSPEPTLPAPRRDLGAMEPAR